MRIRSVLSVCFFVASCLLIAAAGAVTQYTITDLGTLGGDSSGARGINNSGAVVGSSKISDGSYHAFLWQGGTMTDLGTFGGTESSAAAINSLGQVCGGAYHADGHVEAFIWDGGVMTGLGSFGLSSDGDDINDAGKIIGWTDTLYYGMTGYLWDDGSMSLIGLTKTQGINNAGQIVGQIEVGSSKYAGLWVDGVGTSLGSLGGDWSIAYDINELGQVVGYSDTAVGDTRAFLWENGLMAELPTPERDSYAYAVNEQGQIVGEMLKSRHFATIWTNGEVYRLEDLLVDNPGWQLERANDINDYGQIVGFGDAPDGQRHAFLLTPVPEPSVLALAALGVLGLVLRKRRG